ncbi:unnamed protein product [Lathyrus sativus]|nr:unnamed protein product [Lathyrus sativus]
MIYLYWNARGLANSPTNLVLKKIILKHRPGFVFIAEPWMEGDVFFKSWLDKLSLKFFVVNLRDPSPLICGVLVLISTLLM